MMKSSHIIIYLSTLVARVYFSVGFVISCPLDGHVDYVSRSRLHSLSCNEQEDHNMVDNTRDSTRRMRISIGVNTQETHLPAHFMFLIFPDWIGQSVRSFFITSSMLIISELQFKFEFKNCLGVVEVHICIKLKVFDDSQIDRERFVNQWAVHEQCSRGRFPIRVD